MRAELITIGDELLFGQTIDTNAAFIGEKFAEAGVELAFHTTVGDRADDLIGAIGLAMNRVDFVLTTGGLGPTHDDITKKVLCKFFKRQLVFHEDILKSLEKRYSDLGIAMPPVNQNQALLPQGAKFIENKIGSALGLIFEERDKILIAVPGVPAEMEAMVTDSIVPMLLQKTAGQVIVHRKLRTTGIMESAIFEKVKDIIDEKSPIKVAFLPSYKGVDIRLTVRADNRAKAESALNEMTEKYKERIGKFIFGYDNDELPAIIGYLLNEKKLTLAVAESCTGGLLGKTITDIPGSSAYFKGGIISYANELKINLLSVPPIAIEAHGAVSSETARFMAEGIREKCGADIGVSITGVAGPTGGTPEKPVGLVYIGLASDKNTITKEFRFKSNRATTRVRSTYAALDMIRKHLLEIE
ncbi:MAG: competence/damage-inducible protein A [candidate division Zixibacteria bacterium]|nr:competence/damage-inducible protein A [candidate division Zixibacteria bacterium]